MKILAGLGGLDSGPREDAVAPVEDDRLAGAYRPLPLNESDIPDPRRPDPDLAGNGGATIADLRGDVGSFEKRSRREKAPLGRGQAVAAHRLALSEPEGRAHRVDPDDVEALSR